MAPNGSSLNSSGGHLLNSSVDNLNSSFCNQTVFPYVYNLTSSYTYQENQGTVVTTSIIMFILAALFFNLNLFSRVSDVSAILNPSVRLFISTSLSLFLPVMSYLFSEAKNEGANNPNSAMYSLQNEDELPLRARTILIWMLLVELLRKKVEAILVKVGMQWYSGTIDRFARIVWLGYLVYYNVKTAGKKAIYGTLWVLAAAKFLQRVVLHEVMKRSFAYGRNAQLLNSYMTQVIKQEQEQQVVVGSELLKRCKYTVMGEQNLGRKAGPQGYQVDADRSGSTIVTVGDIWTLAATEEDGFLQKNHKLRRLCLSFALYKLLCRRFEDIPISIEETRNCRDLIFKGLCKDEEFPMNIPISSEEEEEEEEEVALFQVFDDEIHFICEYYHSAIPVVFSNPFFFLANYILCPIIVWGFIYLAFIACSNGNVPYAYRSITHDNYIIDNGAKTLTRCLLERIIHSQDVLFAAIDLTTSLLLLLAFIYEEVWEFFVSILSNWLIVSLLCEYTAKRHWREGRIFSGIMHRIQWVRSKLSHPKLCFKQFSVLGCCPLSSLLSFTMRTKVVPKEVKKSIFDYIVAHLDDYDIDGPRSWSTLLLDKHEKYRPLLSSVCQSKSIAEFTLTCHIATSLLEARYPQEEKEIGPHRKVATTLSKYCAYLVAFSPGLLPEDEDGTERAYMDVKKELKEELGGCWWYHLSLKGTRYKRLTDIGKWEQEAATVVQKGAKLGKVLTEKAAEENTTKFVWELLADLWTELMVYIAPSGGELHVKAHKEALAEGGGFITVLWALCTHTGITRPALAPWEVARRAFEEP